jgi:hypothetical protein
MFRDMLLYAPHITNLIMSLYLLSVFLTSSRVALLLDLQSGCFQAVSLAPWYGAGVAFGTATTSHTDVCRILSMSGRKDTLSLHLLNV